MTSRRDTPGESNDVFAKLDTEGGFYDLDEFNFDKLCEEIDAFSADLKEQERK